jgi:hypothetical protein
MLKKAAFSPAHPKLPRHLVLRVGYVEDFDEPRTMLEIFFSALLGSPAVKARIPPFFQQRDAS